MTTIAYRKGVLAADTCISHTDHDEETFTSRTSQIKMKEAWPGGIKDPRFFIASKGDADVGEDMDQLILSQLSASYKTILRDGLLSVMNTQGRRAARLKAVGDSDYTALVAWFYWEKDDDKWVAGNAYEVNNSGKFLYVHGDYAAIGCDKAIALGAMHAGASAEAAVRAAAAHGMYTALPIHVAELSPTADCVHFCERA